MSLHEGAGWVLIIGWFLFSIAGWAATLAPPKADRRDDTVVKKEILDLLPKERIAFVIDDRPRVVRMWKENGLRVIPVAGQCEEF